MIDVFEYTHPRLILTDCRIFIRDEAFRNAYNVCRAYIPPLPLELFRQTPHIRNQQLAVEIHLEYLLNGLVDNVRILERRLLEVILLHRLKWFYEREDQRKNEFQRAVIVMGGMMQQRLTLLLLEMSPQQAARLYGLGKFPNVIEYGWKVELLGAAAAARAIQTFYEIDPLIVRLPTLFEDIDCGIDLFVDVSPTLLLAVSVKSNGDRSSMLAEVQWTPPQMSDQSMDAIQRRAIIQGVQRLNFHLNRQVLPVRVVVGRRNRSTLEFVCVEEDISTVQRMILQLLDTLENENAINTRRMA